jgi:hypothetical protein
MDLHILPWLRGTVFAALDALEFLLIRFVRWRNFSSLHRSTNTEKKQSQKQQFLRVKHNILLCLILSEKQAIQTNGAIAILKFRKNEKFNKGS